MFVQLKDAAVVKPQTFPDGVAALHRRIERTDSRLIAMHEAAVDVYDQITVSLVEFLQHFEPSIARMTQIFFRATAPVANSRTLLFYGVDSKTNKLFVFIQGRPKRLFKFSPKII